MLRTAFAAATLAAIAASASSAFAQDARSTIRNPGFDIANRNLSIRDTATPRIAINPGSPDLSESTRQIVVEPGNGQNGVPPRQNLVITPEQPNPPQEVAADPGREPPRQNIVVNPGQPDPPPQIVVDAGGRPQDEPPRQQIVIDPGQPQAPQLPAAVDAPQQRIDEDLPNALLDAPPAGQPAAPAQQAEASPGQLLEPWQIEFRLGREGFRDVQFVDRNEKYFFVLADAGNYRGLTYLLAIDGYTGAVAAAREIDLNSPRYTPPAQDYTPRYSEAPRQNYAPRYESRYRYTADSFDDCDGRRRY